MPTSRIAAPDPPSADLVRHLDSAIGDRRVLVSHEWVAQRAGSELVFERLAQLFPRAELAVLSWAPGVQLDVPQARIHRSAIDRAWLRDQRWLTLPLMPAAWLRLASQLDPSDLIISSTHAFGRVVGARSDATHLSYVHTPARYLWFPELDGRGQRIPGPLLRRLRRFDLASTQGIQLAANSATTARRIEQVYGATSRVIPPPVHTQHYGAAPLVPWTERTHLLAIGRWIPYKRFDLAMAAARRVGLPLVVAGGGPLEAELRREADGDPTVTFVPDPTDDALRDLYRTAVALVFPALEDFGIVPVEAMAAGTPVVGLSEGGTSETVLSGQTGELARRQTVDEVAGAILRLMASPPDPARCREQAAGFSYAAFDRNITDWVIGALDERPP